MSVWLATEATDAALARMVTGAIFAPIETQRLVVSGETGTYSSPSPGKSKWSRQRNGDPVLPGLLHSSLVEKLSGAVNTGRQTK